MTASRRPRQRARSRTRTGPAVEGRAHQAPTPDRLTVPADVVDRLRLVCLDLPEAYEEPAWTGVRFCIRKKNFAHVLMLGDGWPPAYAEAARYRGPACVLTFRLARTAVAAQRFDRRPFFRPLWFPNIAGVFLDEDTDWDEVGVLLVESYCVLAPKKLVALVDRPRF